jgi:hypothetical protein
MALGTQRFEEKEKSRQDSEADGIVFEMFEQPAVEKFCEAACQPAG